MSRGGIAGIGRVILDNDLEGDSVRTGTGGDALEGDELGGVAVRKGGGGRLGGSGALTVATRGGMAGAGRLGVAGAGAEGFGGGTALVGGAELEGAFGITGGLPRAGGLAA